MKTEPYPVALDVTPPARFERRQLVVRLLVAALLGALGSLVGGVSGFLYLLLPAAAAILVSQRGGERYLAEDGPRIAGLLRWLVAFYAYMALLTDRFPLEHPERLVRFEVAIGGRPTAGSALLRLLTSLPSAIALALLGIVAGVAWIVAALCVLVDETYPAGLYRFQRGILRWTARLLAYHASLVEPYPPFALEEGYAPIPPQEHTGV